MSVNKQYKLIHRNEEKLVTSTDEDIDSVFKEWAESITCSFDVNLSTSMGLSGWCLVGEQNESE